MKYLNTLKQDVSLFGAEIKRAYKLLKVYPLDTINSIISFVIMSVVFMIGINAVGDSTQIFGVVFFPLMLNLIGGPSSSIRNDIEMGVFEQVYISKFSLIKVAIIRSIVAGLSSVVGSVLIGIILHLFFVKITIPFYHLLLLFVLFSIQGLLIGVILAGITLRFRKTETLLNTLNILFMILIVLPLASVSDLFWHIPSLLCPLWGIVTYYQQLLTDPYSPVVLWNLLVVVVNTGFLAFVARACYNKLLNTTKIKGFLGQY